VVRKSDLNFAMVVGQWFVGPPGTV
jgi:hypothetical protein